MYKITIFILILLSFVHIATMQINDLSKDIINCHLIPLFGIQSIYNLSCTSTKNAREWKVNKIIKNSPYILQKLCANFNMCERGLGHYAAHGTKEYFMLLWNNQPQEHKNRRDDLVKFVYGASTLSLQMRAYNCQKKNKKNKSWEWQKKALRQLKKDDNYLCVLLCNGLDPNSIYFPGVHQILLHHAAELGRLHAVKLLLAYGAKIEAKDSEDKTPLHLASERGHASVVACLLQHGAAIDVRDRYGETPLTRICLAMQGTIISERKGKKIIDMLLNRGADPDSIIDFHFSENIVAVFEKYKILPCDEYCDYVKLKNILKGGLELLLFLGLLCIDNATVHGGGRSGVEGNMTLLFH